MKISASMLFDSISYAVRNVSMNKSSTECCIVGILPYLPDVPMSSDHAYVISADSLVDIQPAGDITLIIYDMPEDPEFPLPDCQCLTLCPGISFSEGLGLALSAMERYNGWYEKMQAELTGSPDLNRICDIAHQLLNNPILLFDPNHVLLASVDAVLHNSYLQRGDGAALMLSDDAFKAIINRPEHEDHTDVGQVYFMENPLPAVHRKRLRFRLQ